MQHVTHNNSLKNQPTRAFVYHGNFITFGLIHYSSVLTQSSPSMFLKHSRASNHHILSKETASRCHGVLIQQCQLEQEMKEVFAVFEVLGASEMLGGCNSSP